VSQALVPTKQTEIRDVWQQLSQTRKLSLLALVIAAVVGLVFFFTWAQSPTYTVAYSDLNAEDASAVVAYLKENNISYQLSNNGSSISVPEDQVHEIRLELAGKGLPGKGTVGMELFDNTNLGMTDFMQQVNYQRALEGELARTITSLNSVRSARVHIVIPQPSLFTENQQPTTASVVVELESGQNLNKEQVQAISHLVSSAVEGLTPQNLTIVDMNGHVLADGVNSETNTAMAATTNQIEAQHDYERNMELRIETMLRNVLGPDKAVVRVSSTMNWDQVETQSETYTPGQEGGILRSSREITEFNSSGTKTTGGVPGTTSNIPDTAASFQTQISGTNGSGYNRTDITHNFEVSKSTSKVIPASGKVERLSVSVMVDGITDTVTLSAIEQATIAAAGIDQTRGDVLTVSSIEFNRNFEQEQAQATQQAQQREFYLQIAQWAAVAIALIALFIVVRSLTRSVRRKPKITVEEQLQPPPQQLSPAPPPSPVVIDPRTALLSEVSQLSDSDPTQINARNALLDEIRLTTDNDLPQIGPPAFSNEQKAAAEKAQMIRQLQLMAKNRSEAMAQIIQFWLSEEGNKHA